MHKESMPFVARNNISTRLYPLLIVPNPNHNKNAPITSSSIFIDRSGLQSPPLPICIPQPAPPPASHLP